MRFAVLSDIHGNAPALRLALADAAAHGAESYLFAGDYCISLPWASEVIALLRSLPHAHIIRGNDESHLDIPPGDDAQFDVSRWCMSTLSQEDKAWLDALPETLTLSCEGVDIHMAHASRTFIGGSLHARFRTSVLPGFYPDGPVPREQLQADFRDLANQDEFRRRIDALAPGVYIFGHNHIQNWADFGGRTLLNPGSVGLPLDCGSFGAAYSLLTIGNGQVSVEERRVPYDAEALIRQAMETGQYRAARVWSEIVFSELRTCREKVWFFLSHCERCAVRLNDPRRPFARDTWELAYAEWAAHAREWYPELFVSSPHDQDKVR